MIAVLHGDLSARFGAEHTFQAYNVRNLVSGITEQLGDEFKRAFGEGKWVIAVDGKKLVVDEQVLQKRDPLTTEVHFLPAVEGEHGGFAKVFAGYVLMVAGAVLTAYGYGALGQVAYTAGAQMALGGIAQMLSRKPSLPNNAAQDPNYFFNGGTNTNVEGGPVPLLYGYVPRAGSVQIAQGVTIGQAS